MSAPAQPTTRLRDHRPEPSNLWIRHTAVWAAPAELIWADLSRGGLGGVENRRAGGGRQFRRPSDLVYVPPAASVEESQALVDWCEARQVPFYVHQVAGADAPTAQCDTRSSLATVVVDLLAALVGGQLEALESIPPNGLIVWPTLPGLTDLPEIIGSGLDRLRRSGAERVVPLGIQLSPAAGRRLSERYGERVFGSVFHSGDVDLRPVAQACRARGIEFLPPRPELTGAPLFERRLAAELALIAELWVVSGESPARAQEFFRAAAWVEESRFDVGALAREGNLGIVPALSPAAMDVVLQLAEGRPRSALLTKLVESFGAAP